jgi:hypothetical protein
VAGHSQKATCQLTSPAFSLRLGCLCDLASQRPGLPWAATPPSSSQLLLLHPTWVSSHLFLRQARIRESLGPIEKCRRNILDWPCPGSGTALTWPGKHPYPSPLIDYWMGITWFLPSHRLAKVFKSTRRREACSLSLQILPTPTMLPFVFPLTFNKLHLHPRVL